MALSQSVFSEVLDAFGAGEGVDLVSDAVGLVMQELIELESTEQIDAARDERTDTRTTERSGSRSRLLATRAGDIELPSEAAQGIVLPEHSWTAPPDRSGALRGGDRGVRRRSVNSPCRRRG
jgi:hypothetical protein